MDWSRVEVDVAADAAETTGAALIDTGATGVEERDLDADTVTVVAWFERPPEPDALLAALAASGVEAARRSGLRMGTTPDADWLEIWKRGFEPVPIGERLVILPSWKRDQASAFSDRARLEIDPGMAFGTGTHETTRLCLEWLDREWTGGTLLDVGTGTGILAIAAALLSAEPDRIVGVDVDPLAVEVARENAALNGVADRVELSVGGIDTAPGTFDVVLANLTADVIIPMAAELASRLCASGRLVVSGVLVEQEEDVASALQSAGLAVVEARRQGEWVSVALGRRG